MRNAQNPRTSDLGLLVALAIAIGLLAGVGLSDDGTFGARCHRIYPEDPARYDRCVNNLSKGYPANAKGFILDDGTN